MASNQRQQAQANLDENVKAHLKTFRDRRAEKKPKRQERNEAGLKKSKGYKKDINKYDLSAKGGKQFDGKDLRFLQEAGYSDKEIGKFARREGGKHLSENMRHNSKIAGKYATGDMAEGAKITDHDVGKGFNISDVKYLRSQGFGDAEIAKAANKAVTEGGKRHGAAMAKFMAKQGQLNYDVGAWKNAKEKAQEVVKNPVNETPSNPGNEETTPSNPGNEETTSTQDPSNNNEVSNSMDQEVKQDNDINTTITGDNNEVFNEQDNSIRQYGGDNRSLTINSGRNSKGKYYTNADEAITMGTLGGFYSPDDSPAAQAKFNDLHKTLNKDAQKKYSNSGVQTASKYAGFRGGNVSVQGLQNQIFKSTQNLADKATIQEVKTYGDRAAKTKYPTFQFGDPIEEVKSNAGDIAAGYKKDISDM